jgi:hypothetical protein
MFGPDSMYSKMQWYWLLGALLPVFFYILMRLFPRSPLRLLNAPVYVHHFPPSHRLPRLRLSQHARRHGLASSVSLPPPPSPPASAHLTTLSATPLSFFSWAIVGLIFNYYIHKRWGGWWHTYNYVTAAALDSGLIISTIVIFFAITLPGVAIPDWWGNTAVAETLVSGMFVVGKGRRVV